MRHSEVTDVPDVPRRQFLDDFWYDTACEITCFAFGFITAWVRISYRLWNSPFTAGNVQHVSRAFYFVMQGHWHNNVVSIFNLNFDPCFLLTVLFALSYDIGSFWCATVSQIWHARYKQFSKLLTGDHGSASITGEWQNDACLVSVNVSKIFQVLPRRKMLSINFIIIPMFAINGDHPFSVSVFYVRYIIQIRWRTLTVIVVSCVLGFELIYLWLSYWLTNCMKSKR